MKTIRPLISLLSLAACSLAHATVVDHGTTTVDTAQGIEYLDVGLVRGTYASFSGGVVYANRTWFLATADQLAATWSAATGLNLTSNHILSFDNDMGAAAIETLIGLFDGVTTDRGASGERVIGDYAVDGYYNFFAEGALAAHDVFDDSHFSSDFDGTTSAWLVTAVPETGTSALFALGLLGIGAALKARRA